MPFSEEEKTGVKELFSYDQRNETLVLQLAKTVTKDLVVVKTQEDALNYIFQHVENADSLLHKRSITKEVLFRYLHHKKVSVNNDLSKIGLIQRVLSLWRSSVPDLSSLETNSTQNSTEFSAQAESATTLVEYETEEENVIFPIHALARQFSEWFFNIYNEGALSDKDFWSDAQLVLRIVAEDGCNEHECQDAMSSIQTLADIRKAYNFIYNPNLNTSGVQGRMDVYGLVVILSCGTVHNNSNGEFLGLFECAFRIIRDPTATNNWKVKNIKMLVRSSSQACIPSLAESYSLKEALELPVPTGDLT